MIDGVLLEHLEEKAALIHHKLLGFFGIPEWREPLPPLDELISTILSQNTNDRNRDLAFKRLKQKFETWDAVRDAPVKDVIQAIQVAGLANVKGPRIQQVLSQITMEHGSLTLDFLRALSSEDARAWLLRYKGVGPKTAAIVMQFSLGHQAFPVDTHIYRVCGRLGLRPEGMNVEDAHTHLAALFPSSEYGSAHLNLIRLGREVCLARKPRCEHCPIQEWCDYFKKTDQRIGGIPIE